MELCCYHTLACGSSLIYRVGMVVVEQGLGRLAGDMLSGNITLRDEYVSYTKNIKNHVLKISANQHR